MKTFLPVLCANLVTAALVLCGLAMWKNRPAPIETAQRTVQAPTPSSKQTSKEEDRQPEAIAIIGSRELGTVAGTGSVSVIVSQMKVGDARPARTIRLHISDAYNSRTARESSCLLSVKEAQQTVDGVDRLLAVDTRVPDMSNFRALYKVTDELSLGVSEPSDRNDAFVTCERTTALISRGDLKLLSQLLREAMALADAKPSGS